MLRMGKEIGKRWMASGMGMGAKAEERREVFAWGSGVSGELGMGEEVVSLQQPARVWWGEDEEQEGCCEGLAAGDGFSLFLAGKRLYGCGGDGKSPGDQTGIQRIKVETGEQNETGLQIEGMACGRLHSLLREAGGGALLSMGGGSHGQLGNHFGSPHFRNSPKVVPKMEAPAESCFACGWFHSLACCGPHVYSWGQNHRFQLGHGSDFPANKPRAIDSLSNIPISILAAGLHQSYAVIDNGREVLVWGYNPNHLLFETEKGAKGEPPLQVFPTPVPMGFSRHLQDGEVVKALAAGRAHTSALTSLGRVLCWGANEKGQLGDGTLLSHAAPSTCLLPEDSFVVGLSCGADFSLALTADGHLYAWGCGSDGQLGSALGRIATPLPVLVQFPPNLMPLKAIAGFRHALCILSSS